MTDGWDDDVDDDLTPRRRRNPFTVAVAALLALALAAGVVVVAFDRTEPAEPDLRDGDVGLVPPTSIAASELAAEQNLDEVVAELSAFVAQAREREFLRPVAVTLLDDAAFQARVREDAIEDLAELDETEGVFRALGLLEDDVDLAESLRSFLGAGVVGFYDPETEELVLRGASLTPYVRLTLVHELTHALDDQHFELHRPALDDADDETGFAFGALVEGNAVRIEDEYRATLSDDERDAAATEEARLGAGIDLSSIPRVLPELIGFPYAFGPAMVDALVDEGGEARVDAAFDEPPATSEQVLDPEAWLDGDAPPISVPPPPADGEVFDQGALGLWGLYVILAAELGSEDAVDAARGWGGDWYVAWRAGDETCIRATIVMDDGDELRELASALDDWAAAQDDADIGRGDADDVTIESCG